MTGTTPDALHQAFAPRSLERQRYAPGGHKKSLMRRADRDSGTMQQLRYWSIVASEQAAQQKVAFGRDERQRRHADLLARRSRSASRSRGKRRGHSALGGKAPCWAPGGYVTARPVVSD